MGRSNETWASPVPLKLEFVIRSLIIRSFTAILLACLVACTQHPSLPEGDLTFQASDGVQLVGRAWGMGEPAVIMVYWSPFALEGDQDIFQEIADLGVTVFTFNFRGFTPSQGEYDVSAASTDLAAAYDYLRLQGYDQFICVGASMGGTVCLQELRQQGLAGLVTLSAPLQITAWRPTAADFRGLEYRKLFVAAELEGSGATAAEALYAMASEPKELILYEGTGAHATRLFTTHYGEDLKIRLIQLVEDVKESSP